MEIQGVLAFTSILLVTGAAGFLLFRYVAQSALAPRVTLHPDPARLNKPLQVKIDLWPRQSVKVDQIELTLTCHKATYLERAPTTDGLARAVDLASNRTRDFREKQETICREHVCFPIGREFQPGQAESLELTLEVPGKGLYTNRTSEFRAWWTLQIRFAIPGFPDAVLDQFVNVQ